MLVNLLQGPQARRHRRRLRPSRADVPPRARRHLQGQPRLRARHPPPADGPRAPGDRDAAASRSSRRRRSRPTTSSPRSPPRAATRATTSSSSPATATSTSSSRTRTSRCSTTSAACPTTRSTTRPGIHERTGVTPALYPQYAALRGDPSDNLPGRARGGGEDGGQADHHLRRPRRHLRAPRRADAEAPREPRRERGPRAPERRGDGARPRRRRSTVGIDDLVCDQSGDRRRRGPPALRVPRVPHPVRPAGRGPRHRPRARRRPRPRCSRRRSTSLDDRPTRRQGARRRSPADDRAARAGRGVDRRGGPVRLEGLALVRDGATGDVRVDPGRAARRRRACAAALGALAGLGGRPLAAHQAKPLVRALTSLDVDVRSLALDTALAAYLLDPAESRYLLEELVVRYAGARIPDGDAAAEGQLDLDGSATPASTVDRPGGPSPSTGWWRRSRRPRRPGPARAQRRHRGPARRRARPHGGRRRRGRPRRAPARCATGSSPTSSGTGPRSSRPPGTTSTSTPRCSCARSSSTSSASRRRRRRRPASPPTPPASRSWPASTRSSSTCCATARSRSCARPTATACSQRSAADGRIHATFNQTVARTGRLSSDQPNLHNIPVRSELGREFRKAFVPADGLRAARRRLQPDRAALHRPPRRGPRADRQLRVGPRHPHRDRVADLRRRGRRRHHRAAVEGEDGLLRPGLRHGGLRARPAAQHPHRGGGRDPRRLLRGVPGGEGVHGAHRRRGPRARATPRRCSAGAARSPSWPRRTSGSARRASARR